MRFFALDNVALALLYYVFEWKDIAPSGYGVLGGLALAALFSYVKKDRSLGSMLLVVWVTAVVTSLLFYGSGPIVSSGRFLFLMMAFVIGTWLGALQASALWFIDRRKIPDVVGWVAFCATVTNTLPLISFLST